MATVFRGPGYPVTPTFRVRASPPPGSSVVAPLPQVGTSDPGDYFSGKVTGIGNRYPIPNMPVAVPDCNYWFQSQNLYNCLEVDQNCQSYDRFSWFVPQLVTLSVLAYVPPYFDNPPHRGETTAQGNARLLGQQNDYPWAERDFTFQPINSLLQGANAHSFENGVNGVLPDRQIFRLYGLKPFRFALLSVWMYDNDPYHPTLTVGSYPDVGFRVWYDRSQTSLTGVR